MPLFDGKVLRVTGSSSKIGQAACHLYAHEGAEAVVWDVSHPKDCQTRAASVMETYGNVAVAFLGQSALGNSSAYVAAKQSVVALTKNTAVKYAHQGLRCDPVGRAFIRSDIQK